MLAETLDLLGQWLSVIAIVALAVAAVARRLMRRRRNCNCDCGQSTGHRNRGAHEDCAGCPLTRHCRRR